MTLADGYELFERLDLRASDDLRALDAPHADWLKRYARAMVLVDAALLVVATSLGALARYGSGAGDSQSGVHGVPYVLGALGLVPLWILTMSLSRCYESRFLGNGTEEFKRVFGASFRLAALVVFALYMTKTDASRGVLLLALLTGSVGLVLGRYVARVWLHRQRRRGACMHKTVVVGPAAEALEMTTALQAQPLSGLLVVGACVVGDVRAYARQSHVPVLGSVTDVVPVLEEMGADTVVVAKGEGVSREELRALAQQLEGTSIDLLVSPSLTNVTGSRIHWRTVPGLSLLHVEEPELDGARRLVKAAFDRVVGSLLLLAATPVLAACALAVRMTSPGPAFFRQERVGKDGQTFTIWKLRTMHADAEDRLRELRSHNVHGAEAVLFKLHDDPRVTRAGGFLRRFSLDELPQLINVVRGDMSLVGPRPPLPHEVAKYDGNAHRRLLVKPGMTGLWQVSGRSDLGWEDTVRLDLHYVENWSLGLDIAVLCKTAIAVVRPSGAY